MTPLLAALLALASPTPPGVAGCVAHTGSSATLLIPARPALSRAGSPLQSGDEVSVFTPEGTCVGTGRWEGAGVAVALWADDPTTPEADGLRPGDPVRFVVRDASTGATYAAADVEVTFEATFGTEGGYRPHGLYAVAVAPEEATPPAPAPPAPETPAPAPPAEPEQNARPRVVAINEVEADQGPTDTAEFVEIRSLAPDASLDGLALVLVDERGTIYESVDLSAYQTDSDGLLVVRPDGPHGASVDATSVAVSVAEIRDGTGAVAVYEHSARGYKVGTQAGTDRLVDAVVFGPRGAGRSAELLAQLGQTVQYVETAETSLQRLDVADYRATAGVEAFASALLHPLGATPGVGNGSQLTVDRTAEVQDAAGLRLVSVPVVGADGRPKAVADLAAVNLVRGVAGGSHPAQYPGAAPNVFVGYDDASGDLVAPTSTDEALVPGGGFFWHWFDEEAAPSDAHGGGTSRGHDLGSDAFTFSATGVPIDDALLDGPYVRSLSAGADGGVHLIGNPYPYPLPLSGVGIEGGTLHTTVAVWDPVRGTYEDLFSGPDGSDVLPVWGGAVAEVSGAAGTVRVVTTSGSVDPTAAAPVEVAARRRTATAAARLSFDVTGTLAGGAAVADASAHVRFVEGATAGWDRHDGSKLAPPTEAFALVAPVGMRDGSPRRQRVLSLPTALGAPRAVPLAFAASHAGAFTLRWDLGTLPSDWGVQLHDLETGATVDLRRQAQYAFETSAATPWAERFEVVVAPAATAGEPVAGRETTVSPAYPNPAVGRVRLDVRSATAQRVAADVYDALGRRVARAFDGSVSAGTSATVTVDTAAFAPGLYVVRVEGETFREARRLVVAR